VSGPAVSDHYTPAAHADGGDADRTIYRVVGVRDDHVTLLRLTDADGTRQATGELLYVAHDELDTAFAVADDPDPRWAWPDYLGGLFVVLGAGLVVYPATDLLSGAVMVLAGAYLLWRRQSWRR
jgi:hypothetical protein